MRHALSNEPWKSLLPDASLWLDRVTLDVGPGSVSGAHHVIAVKSVEDDKQGGFALNAPSLPDAAKKAVDAAARALGWRPAAGAGHVVVDGAGYTLVPQTSIKVGPVQAARQLGLDTAKALKELRLAHVAICDADGLSGADVFEGFAGGVYNHVGFKGARKRDEGKLPGTITLAGSKLGKDKLTAALAMARASTFCRFLQDAPPNYLNPVRFAEIAKDLAQQAGVKCTILDREAMTKLGMHSFLSVADGSFTEPRLIAIEIDGQDNGKSVALVGKGLTFDAGGVSIKPSAGMEEMKYDMSGGAAVLGAAHYFAGGQKPPVKVYCVIGATENLVSANATRPSDIVRAHNGKTIEILNTDAEGRLVLADVLSYVIKEHKPDMVIDIATLTGAVLMALGCVGAAVMGNQDTVDYVVKCGAGVGEPLWQLPLWPELEKEVKSEIADLKNIAKSNVKAGSIIGAVFLKEFVGDAKWAHLDIAGTGWNCQAVGFPPSGSSAFGLRTLVNACLQFNR